MKITVDNIRMTYRLDYMNRYNTWQRLHNETVAAHSYYVVLFTMMICDDLEVSQYTRKEAIDLAILHDIPEAIMNDVTYDAKQSIPGLTELMHKFEESFLREHFPDQADYAFGEAPWSGRNAAREIVKLADVYSSIQYCDNEVMLGNKHFESVIQEARMRANVHLKNLEGWYGKKCQKIMLYIQ